MTRNPLKWKVIKATSHAPVKSPWCPPEILSIPLSCKRLRRKPESFPDILQTGAGLVEIGFDPQRLLKLLLRLRQTVLLDQGDPQMIVGIGEIGIHPHRLLKALDGLGKPIHLLKSQPQIVQGLGVIGLDPQRLLKCSIASGMRFCRYRANPRLLWASAKSGLFSIAF